jgi:N-acetyl-anhydromuramyl-L-alanine amidase AmpD
MKIIQTKLNIDVPRNNKPSYIIIHHALAKNCTIQDVHSWHRSFGWAGCGYHYFIDKRGNIFTGREENQRGSHCKEGGMNYKSIGICLEGCYQEHKNQTEKQVPKSQLESLTNLTKYLMNKYDIGTDRVKKHHDYAVYKLCPGNYFPWDKYIYMLSQNKDNIIELKKENEKIQEENTRYNKILSDIKVELDKIERMIQDGTNT